MVQERVHNKFERNPSTVAQVIQEYISRKWKFLQKLPKNTIVEAENQVAFFDFLKEERTGVTMS